MRTVWFHQGGQIMPQLASTLSSLIFKENPYRGFDPSPFALDLQGGGGDPIITRLVESTGAKLIIEVGSWKGSSAIQMAEALRTGEVDGVVVCVDTWLGGLEHMMDYPGWEIRPYYRNGYPTLYHQFLANVVHRNCQDFIVPFPNTSLIGARWFVRQKLQADLIYVDGSHDEDDVYADLTNYWKILRPGGVMFGDDWNTTWYGVVCAVNRFVRERELDLRFAPNRWIIRRPD
jgi:hypothetical protein